MHPSLKPQQWSDLDTANTLAFLQSDTGARLLERICMGAPTPSPGTDPSYVLGQLRGWSDALDFLKAHTAIQAPAARTEEFPNLDEETEWNGLKPK